MELELMELDELELDGLELRRDDMKTLPRSVKLLIGGAHAPGHRLRRDPASRRSLHWDIG